MVRAYKSGTKKANHKSTLPYWKKYLSVKESLPSRYYFTVQINLLQAWAVTKVLHNV